jgi:hypothetical protein
MIKVTLPHPTTGENERGPPPIIEQDLIAKGLVPEAEKGDLAPGPSISRTPGLKRKRSTW